MSAARMQRNTPPPGGAACLYGVLYQVLSSLDQALRITVDGNVQEDQLKSALLVLEPADGGDLQVVTPVTRTVEQYKTRGGRTWALTEVLKEVLPDLYRAVSPSPTNQREIYRFVTDGKQGKWKGFLPFCKELRTMDPDQLPDCLDDKEPICSLNKKPHTRKAVFLEAKRHVQRNAPTDEEQATTHEKLHRLLTHFSFLAGQLESDLLEQINSILVGYLDDPNELQDKRDQLVGWVLAEASKGRFEITPEGLLERAGLRGRPASAFDEARSELQILAKQTAARDFDYEQEHDVRSPVTWPPAKRVVVLSGASGQGKSWRLAQALLHEEVGLPILQSTCGHADSDVQQASNTAWARGYGRFTQLTLPQLRSRLHTGPEPPPESWLSIGIDNVEDNKLAQRLIAECLGTDGVRLALTTPSSIGRALAKTRPDDVHHVDVGDFTRAELREYLARRGRASGAIPKDVRDTLAKPLLARLYCDLAEDTHWQPAREYELYERYWDDASIKHEGPNHPEDRARLKRLARVTREDPTAYPWTLEQRERAGLSDEAARRLERTGWLRSTVEDQYDLPHDRLLSWLVAQTFADDLRNKDAIGTPETLNGLVEDYWVSTRVPRWRGYVAMDVLWMLCNEHPDEAALVVAALDQHSHTPTDLYEELLPTLGPRVVTPLRKRLHSITESDKPVFALHAARALVGALDKGAQSELAQLLEMLDDDSNLTVESALIALASRPCAIATDRVWELHQESTARLSDTDDRGRFIRYEYTINALKACAREHPDWVASRIADCDPTDEPIGELAYVLASMGPAGHTLWKNVKLALLKKTSKDNPRGTIACIRVYKDADEIPRLREWLRHESHIVKHAAFAALARNAPDQALEVFQSIDPGELALFANWWLPELLLQVPSEARTRLLQSLQSATADEFWTHASVWASTMNAIDAPILETMLGQLEQDLVACENAGESQQRDRLRRPLRFLNRVHRLDLLEVFEGLRDTAFSTRLCSVAASWLPKHSSTSADSDIECARGVLDKIGGNAAAAFLLEELKSTDKFYRISALERAPAFPTSEIRTLLRERVVAWTPTTETYSQLEQQFAIRALAALGESQIVLDAILQPHSPPTQLDTPDWASPTTGVHLTDLQSALDATRSEDEETVIRGLSALLVSSEEVALRAIPAVLKRWDDVDRFRVLTLQFLSRVSEKNLALARVISSGVSFEKHPHFAVEARLAVGDDDSLCETRDYLFKHRSALTKKQRVWAAWLAVHRKDRALAEQAVWPAIRLQDTYWWKPDEISALALVADPDASAALWDLAYRMDESRMSNGTPTRYHAIRALARIDHAGALEAAQHALATCSTNALQYACLVLELGDRHIADEIVQEAVRDRAPARVLRAVAIALRKAPIRATESALGRALNDSATERSLARACYITGWQADQMHQRELGRLARENPSDQVRTQALKAIERQVNGHRVERLRHAVSGSTGQRTWAYVQAFIALGEPDIPIEWEDSFSLGAFWQVLPAPVRHSARKHIGKRAKELEREHKQEAESLE